jgi:hypothetical protein
MIAFGPVPALLLAFDLLTAPPPCPSPGSTIQGQGYECGEHYEGYDGLAAIFGAIALLGLVWPLVRWLWAQRHRP